MVWIVVLLVSAATAVSFITVLIEEIWGRVWAWVFFIASTAAISSLLTILIRCGGDK